VVSSEGGSLMKHRAPAWILTCAATICSWLIAVLVLMAVLRFLPVTLGYMPDHLE
jgi:hypothetical protein